MNTQEIIKTTTQTEEEILNPETNPETNTETNPETNTETNTETDTETGAETGTETDTETGTETGTETDTEIKDDTPTVLPNIPTETVGFQAVNSNGEVIGFISKTELVQECKNALYQDLAILEQNRPMFLPADSTVLQETSTLSTATDQYEDELPIKSDAPYVRGLDALGNPIRISKADLASVVGGLLESTGIYPFMDRGPLSEGTDLNTINKSGIYFTNGGKNFPDTKDSFPMTYSVLRVFKSSASIIQEITNVNYSYCNNYFIRVSTNDGKTWYSWKKVTLSVGHEYEPTDEL